ncbi:MAG TPA: LCP family protein [Anaerolineales bacterium]|nr:LCP family protein [Anaerolineales bacterium]
MQTPTHYPSRKFHSVIRLLYGAIFLVSLACNAVNTILLPTITPIPSSTSTPTFTPTPTLTPTATEPTALCGAPPAMFILIIGSDSRRDNYSAGLADSIRIARVDFIHPRVQILTFPRDLYVEIPGIDPQYNITHGKLNQAYLYGNPSYNYYSGPGQGPGLLANTLKHNFDARVDHYLAVNLQTFVRVVDAVGGIDINLPYTIDGRVKGSKDPNLYFPAGPQHLNGYRTMLLARMRPQGDFQRIEIQNLILHALASKLLSPAVIPNLPSLIEAFHGSVQTDLGTVEIGQLLCLASMLNAQQIELLGFPETIFTSQRYQDPVLGNTSVLVADFNVLRAYVQEFNQGAWSVPTGEPNGITHP